MQPKIMNYLTHDVIITIQQLVIYYYWYMMLVPSSQLLLEPAAPWHHISKGLPHLYDDVFWSQRIHPWLSKYDNNRMGKCYQKE